MTSYDETLQRLREVEIPPPSFTEIEQRRRWRAEAMMAPIHGRDATIATIVAMLGYIALTIRPVVGSMMNPEVPTLDWWRTSLATLLPAALLLWAIRLLGRRGVGPQMLLRAVLWSNLIVGALIAGNFLTLLDRGIGAAIAVACAIAIIRLGGRGLEDDAPSEVFRPVRFRGHLLLALVMAFADAQTLLFAAAMQLRIGMAGWNLSATIVYAGPITIAAATMALTVWGLYRLRTWALLLNLVANVAIAHFALDGALNVSTPVAAALAATAAVQMFLPVPILAVALGDRKAGQPLVRAHATSLVRISVIVIAGIAIAAAILTRRPSGWLTGPGHAFARGLAIGSHPRMELDFVEANLTGHDVDDRDYRQARMRGAHMNGVQGKATFEGADLRYADLREARLRGSSFTSASLGRADLRGADLRDTSMERTDLTGADLRGADLRGARLELANLTGAALDAADFREADLTGAYVGLLPRSLGWEGASCPDGTPADPEDGCHGREGHVNDRSIAGTYQRVEDDWQGMPPECPELGIHLLIAETHLYVLEDRLVRTSDGNFVSRAGTLTFDRGHEPLRAEYRHERCGSVTLERTP